MQGRYRWLVLMLGLLLIASTLGCGSVPTAAAKYPTGPVTMIVPYKGGTNEKLARLVAPELQKQMGVPVVIEVIPGADGWNRVFQAKPDGYTIGVGDIVGEYGLALMQKMPYDLRQFTLIGRINAGTSVLAFGSQTGIKTLDDMKRVGKEKTLRYASFGFSAAMVQAVLMAEKFGIKIAPVSFPGPADTVLGVVRGDADFGLVGTWLFMDQITAGKVTPVLAWTDVPEPALPNVPDLKKAALLDLGPVQSHRIVMAPPKMPADVTNAITKAFRDAVGSEAMKKQLTDTKLETNPLWGDDFRKEITAVFAMMDKHKDTLVKAAK